MSRSVSPVVWAVAGLMACLVLTAWLTPGCPMLEVNLVQAGQAQEGERVLALPICPGERFTIHYFHSVENAPIWEAHSMDRTGRIFIEEERYEKFGAGMGKMPGVGRMVTRGKYEAIVDMHMPVGSFILRVGSIGVDHTLIWRDKRFNLSKFYAHRALLFQGKPQSLLDRVWYFLGFGPPPILRQVAVEK